MKLSKFYLIATLITSFILLLAVFAFASEIDMHKIMMIESSGNPKAYNKNSEASGLFQITPICLKEYNNYHPSRTYRMSDMFNESANREVATWYLTKRIPQMLRYYKKPVTVNNILISYNAGIGYVVSGGKLPKETVNYIKKYRGAIR